MKTNIRISRLANNLALVMVFEYQINMILIQKLWLKINLNRKMIKKHNVYDIKYIL